MFARAEDRERARLLRTPCTAADVGRGCHRSNGRLFRQSPCSYRIDAGTIGSLPTDQCYKMDRPRRYRGVWIDEFEGQRSVPEGTTPPAWPRDPRAPGWREETERARAATIWLEIDRAEFPRDVGKGARGGKSRIEFVGRKTAYPGRYGHLGISGAAIVVDRVIALEPLE